MDKSIALNSRDGCEWRLCRNMGVPKDLHLVIGKRIKQSHAKRGQVPWRPSEYALNHYVKALVDAGSINACENTMVQPFRCALFSDVVPCGVVLRTHDFY